MEGTAKATIVEAIEGNMFVRMAHFARQLPQMEVIDDPDLLLINSGLPSDTFNFVCRAKLAKSDADRRIAFAIDYFKSRQFPFAWWVGPGSQPDDLGTRLEAHGLKRVEEELGMAMDLEKLSESHVAPDGLVIRRATRAEEVEDFARINAANWDPPDVAVMKFYRQVAEIALRPDSPTRFYVGYLNGEAVAASELFLGAGVAGLYNISTLTRARNRGIGTAMTAAPLQDARKQGVRTAILQASDDGKNIYAHLGFETYCDFHIYQ
ncbi:MAG TPA: GNAT family N-acetyltransferase [Blastocatellia bacterium]|nr:GNAT family N-acetyltransferase [Blastocatellia bacterium]